MIVAVGNALASIVLVLEFAPAVARANPAGEVPSARVLGIGEPVHVSAAYEAAIDRAVITREVVGDPDADPLAPLPRRRELAFRQTRHQVTPKLEFAVYRDTWLSFAVPIVVAQSRELSLVTGAERAGTTTFGDGLLTGTGFDARAPGSPPSGSLVFRGVQRAGVGELRGGLGFAAMNQARDPSKPTWKLGAELRFAIGRVMRFDAADPGRATGVSTGVHEVRLWTSFDRRFRYFEGWFDAYWQRPIYTRGTALATDPGFGAASTAPGQVAGASFGIEAYVIDDRAAGTRISLDLGARLAAHFEGRSYTEMWEVFAYAGDARTGGPLVLDADPTTPGPQPRSHPGISNHEGYLETAGRVALRARLGRHLALSAVGELVWRTERVISFADAGVDLPTCPTSAPRCEPDANDVVNPGTAEINPLHVRKIDLVGHRYRAEDSRGVVLGVEARLTF
jgi:hypothetical protein